jgi:hypothetical protein
MFGVPLSNFKYLVHVHLYKVLKGTQRYSKGTPKVHKGYSKTPNYHLLWSNGRAIQSHHETVARASNA